MSTLGRPHPLGYGGAAREAHTIAAPLLAAAALSLAGVVAGADSKAFLWPGPTLLLLVATALALIVSIQLHYYARQFLYSRAEIEDWYPRDIQEQPHVYEQLCEWQGNDFQMWSTYCFRAVLCFDAGTLLLGLGVAIVLLPPDGSRQGTWRLTAAALVLLCTIADGMWTVHLSRRGGDLQVSRSKDLTKIITKEGEAI